ncbi:hypothetical protein FOL47_009971 [Perkinsus chesapeaki]|uniref:Uncharacterized protein n=1 Tax=Perkinsus chesapeaki TaxID=330153 RepID=A0A7J6L5I6_PERCH|nr:hypothetical protein FOL47_009971 [Perkinsus chesapeaki]
MRTHRVPKLTPCHEEDVYSQVSPVAKSMFAEEPDLFENSYKGFNDAAVWRSPESSYLDSSLRSLPVFPRARRGRGNRDGRRPIKALVRKASERSLIDDTIPLEAKSHSRALLSSSPNLRANWRVDEPIPQARHTRRVNAAEYPPKQRMGEHLDGLPLNERCGIKEELRRVRDLLTRTEAAINKAGCSATAEASEGNPLLGKPVAARTTKPAILMMELEAAEGVDVGSAPVSTRATSSAPVSVIHGESKTPVGEEYRKVVPSPEVCNVMGKKEGSCFCGAVKMIRGWKGRS